MSAHSHAAEGLTKDELTDDVIETLYDIVRRAQSSSDATTTALFAAYEAVLAELGLQPRDDALLYRFLFRMQAQQWKDEGLVQRFRRVLGELGIEVEVDDEGEGIEVTTGLDGTRQGGPVMPNGVGRYERRGSFDSFFDGTADKVPGIDYGDSRPRTRRGSHDVSTSRGYGRRRATSDTEAQSYQQVRLPLRNGENGHQHQRAGSEQHRRASVSSRGSLQIRRGGLVSAAQVHDDDTEGSEFTDRTTSLDLSRVQVPGVNAPIPDYRDESSRLHDNHVYHHREQYVPESRHQHKPYVIEPYRPSDTRLMDDAEAFEHQRLHRVMRQCLYSWRARLGEQIGKYREDERTAIEYDRKILLKQAFGNLYDAFRVRRSTRATEEFFKGLENQADKARKLFLWHKAFTHWACRAEDEIKRTATARRHMIRTRFFNGWKEITAVNEGKIQRFVLGNFFRQWRMRATEVREIGHHAMLVYERNLVHRVFKTWFFRFCEMRAPAWHDDHVKRAMLRKWSEIVRVLREREAWAIERGNREVARKALKSWQERMVTVQALTPQADDFRRSTLLTSTLWTLHKQSQLVAPFKTIQARIKHRLLRTALQDWHRQTQLSHQARDVDRLRVLRNAYTAWNDNLRIRALQERIDDRIAITYLYKWTLASRVSLYRRVRDRDLKESLFKAWATKRNQRVNTLDNAEHRFAQFKRNQLLRGCLRKLEVATAEKRAEQFAIVANYQQKIKERSFAKLKERHEHLQELEQWANRGSFFVLGHRMITMWNDATQHKRRERRRTAYAQVRRTVKTNLVRRMYGVWKEKADTVAAHNLQAYTLRREKNEQKGRELLHKWHEKINTIHQLNTQASAIHGIRIASQCLHTWKQYMVTLQTMNTQALALHQESTEIAASGMLKKLGWRLWNIRRQEDNARALYERNFEKHVRAMLRFWLEQTLIRRPVVEEEDDDDDREGSSDEDGNGNDDDDEDGGFGEDGDETRRLEAWTAFDENALGLNNDLDLELSITPERRSNTLFPTSTTRPPQILTPYPNPYPPSPIEEQDDEDFDDPSAFWSGTPLPPRPSSTKRNLSAADIPLPKTSSKPGYLKTPSKRSVARAKRPELPRSPEKRPFGTQPSTRLLGSMSAPPARGFGSTAFDTGTSRLTGVTSFERRLRDNGFGATPSAMRGRGVGKAKGKGRVGFGDVSEIG